MEESQRNTRRRTYSFEPNDIVYAGFSQRYMSYLLPALFNASSITPYCRNKDNKIEKKVRLKVDMALALSAGGFRWSHALKHKLERCMNARNSDTTFTLPSAASSILVTSKRRNHFCIAGNAGHLHQPLPAIPRPIKPNAKPNEAAKTRRVIWWRSGSSKKANGADEELRCRVRVLRRILPGGSEMNSLYELLSEVQSYVVCLQLQVNVLRSIVDTV